MTPNLREKHQDNYIFCITWMVREKRCHNKDTANINSTFVSLTLSNMVRKIIVGTFR